MTEDQLDQIDDVEEEQIAEQLLKGPPVGWFQMGGPNGPFMQGKAKPKPLAKLPAGSYQVVSTMAGTILMPARLLSDTIIALPDTENDSVVASIQAFWKARQRFKSKGQLYKRGILMEGPPGSGKTIAVLRIAKELISSGGLVMLWGGSGATGDSLKMLRELEPDRPVVVIIEDLDNVISKDKRGLLALLDGETQVDNVVYLATTNYIDKLPPEIANRPSRFDEIVHIGFPSAAARKIYIRSLLNPEELSDKGLEGWLAESEGLGIAHLKELVVATYCLGRDPSEVIKRLRKMGEAANAGEQLGSLTAKA